MSECKYKLPCGMCDLTNLFCNIVPTSKNSCDIASSVEYRDAIEFLKREVAVTIKEERGKRYYEMAIEALKRERDMYFPGYFTKKGGGQMLSDEEAIKMLSNYKETACQTCRIGKYIDCLEKCKLLQAVEVGIEAIKYKQAVYNLGKAVTKK